MADTFEGIGPSLIVKRSVIIEHHKTSVSLEEEFWKMLHHIRDEKHTTIQKLIGQIDQDRHHGNLSSAIRLYVLKYTQNRMTMSP